MAIEFACPLCGKQTIVADQYAGQTGPCANCGGQITIPLSGLGAKGPTSAPSSGGGANVLFVILAVLGVGALVCCGGVGALFFVGRSQVQVASKRVQSTNNLKQIGVALHNYHDMYGELPPAVVTDKNGKPLYSGRVLLLPLLGQQPLFDAFDKSKAWDSPENVGVSNTVVSTFQDPANPSNKAARSDYVFVTGMGTIFEGKKARFSAVRDGLSNTIAIVATNSGPDNWAAPGEWNVDSGAAPGSNHEGKVLTLYADGSVRLLRTQYFQQNMRALATRAGDEVVPPDQ
jgi:hypothetical protein